MTWWQRLVTGALTVGALASIGWGCWLLHPAAALIVVGALVWIDMTRGSHGRPE